MSAAGTSKFVCLCFFNFLFCAFKTGTSIFEEMFYMEFIDFYFIFVVLTIEIFLLSTLSNFVIAINGLRWFKY